MKATAKTPRDLAAETVQEWFDALVGDFDAVNENHSFGDGGFLPDVDLEGVKAAILAKDKPVRSEHEDDFAREERDAEVKAAYLIGVQLGMRLRGTR